MMQLVTRKTRGITGSAYALLVGLVSITVLTAVSSIGAEGDRLFDDVATQLANSTQGAGAQPAASSPLPADPDPPVIPAGQSFSTSNSAAAGEVIGTLSASDQGTGIVGWAITAGDPGGGTPYFSISSAGDLSFTQAGVDNLHSGSFSLTVTATDGGGNSSSQSITIAMSYNFSCEGGGNWLGYADLTNGDRVNLCLSTRGNNVFSNPDVLTSCLSTSQFTESFFRNPAGSPALGAVRYERAYSSGQLNSANFNEQFHDCSNAACTSSSLNSSNSFTDQRQYIPSVELCTVSLDSFSIPYTSNLQHYRQSHQLAGSSVYLLYSRNMGGVQQHSEVTNLSHYRVFRSRNGAGGTVYSATGTYSFLQRD